MPKILVVAATAAEITHFMNAHSIKPGDKPGLLQSEKQPSDVFVLITGAGMVSTAFELGKLIGSHFDVVINAGVAGSFNRFEIGDVVNVTKDCFSEFGAEDDRAFLSVDQLGLGRQHIELEHPFSNNFISGIPKTNGITVNTVHGNEKSISRVVEKYQPYVESMEGAAFLHAANAFGWKAIQLRAVSNKVTKRDKSSWNLQLAITNLNESLHKLVHSVLT
jgi:futalosine hydrolase